MNTKLIDLYTEPTTVDSWGGYPESSSLCGPRFNSPKHCRFCGHEPLTERLAFATYDNLLASAHSTIRICSNCGWWGLEGSYSEDDSGFTSGALIQPDLVSFPVDSLDLPVRHLAQSLVLKTELLHQIHPRKFEELIASVFREYFDCEVAMTKQTRDGGKDLVCCDSAGGRFLVEIKRYAPGRNIGVGLVQRLTGVMYENGVRAGVLVTTSDYTRPAREAAKRVNSMGKLRLDLADCRDILRWLDSCAHNYRQSDVAIIASKMKQHSPRVPFTAEMEEALLTW